MASLVRRLHGMTLHLLPAATRVRLGDELAVVFAVQLADAGRTGGRWAAARLATRELAALVGFAWVEHRQAARRRRIDDDRLAAGRSPAMIEPSSRTFATPRGCSGAAPASSACA